MAYPKWSDFEKLLAVVGPEVFSIHEESIPLGIHWLGREYTLEVTEEKLIWRFRDMVHRENGPAIIYRKYDRKEWHQFGKPHRIDEPAIEEILTDGRIFRSYCYMGYPHRIGGPAIETIDTLYNVHSAQWFWHNRLHREDGPAVVDNKSERYFIDGMELSKAEHAEWVHKYKDVPLRIW